MSAQVSVIIPTYNAEVLIGNAIACVQKQTLQDLEIVCVDDGSTDGTLDAIAQLAKQDARIKLISQKNAGAGSARNAGIKHASGQFVTFLDTDDHYSCDNYLETLVNDAKQNNVQVAGANFWVNHQNNFTEDDFSDDPVLDGYTFTTSGMVNYEDYQYDYGFHRFIFAKSLFSNDDDYFPALAFYEDPVFLVHMLLKVGKFYAESQCAYVYFADYKVRQWKTPMVADMLRGVETNLALSNQLHYQKLHWYTLVHYDSLAGDIGVCLNDNIDFEALKPQFDAIEALVNKDIPPKFNPNLANFETIYQQEYTRAQSQPGLILKLRKAKYQRSRQAPKTVKPPKKNKESE